MAAITALFAAPAMLSSAEYAQAGHSCTGRNVVPVAPGQDLDATVANSSTPGADVFCVEAGTYKVD